MVSRTLISSLSFLAVTPYAKIDRSLANVVDLLEQMKATSDKDMKAERDAYEVGKTNCQLESDGLVKDIADDTTSLNGHRADEAKAEENIEDATQKKTNAEVAIKTLSLDLGVMEKQRKIASGAYQERKNELEQGIEACKMATEQLNAVPKSAAAKKSKTGLKGYGVKAALIQTGFYSFLEGKSGSSVSAIKELLALAGEKTTEELKLEMVQIGEPDGVKAGLLDGDKEETDPKALVKSEVAQGDRMAYTRSSKLDFILELIADVQKETSAELAELTTRENEQQQSYDLEKNTLDNTVKESKATVEEKATLIGQEEGIRGQATKDAKTMEARIAKQKSDLKSLTKMCKLSAVEYERNSKARAEELVAIDMAMSILRGEGAPEEKKGTSFLQLKNKVVRGNDAVGEKLASFLKSRGTSLKSDVLMQLAAAAQSDPFGKIKNLINELINRLTSERLNEQAQANECGLLLLKSDNALAKAKEGLQSSSLAVEDLEARLTKRAADVKTSSVRIQVLNKELSESAKAFAAAQAAMSQEIEDLKEAETKVAGALDVLTRYYESVDANKSDDLYAGNSGSNAVFTALERVQLDMLNERGQIEETKSKSKADFEERTKELKSELGDVKKNLVQDRQTMAEHEESKATSAEDKSVFEEQFNKETDFRVKQLNPKCVQTGVSFEDRAKARAEEIQSLEDALEILKQV